jgi:cobalamin biosynthesis Co2+ chelatase CbiK
VGKFPTKLFEAIFIGKPVLCQKGGYFSKLASRYTKVIDVNFDQPIENDFELILEEIKSHEPHSLYSEKFVFDHAGLKSDLLSLLEPDFNIEP